MRAKQKKKCPFKIGQDVEILSHKEGYRGGFFRCKIHDMKCAGNGRESLHIEYLDFPGQGVSPVLFILFSWMPGSTPLGYMHLLRACVKLFACCSLRMDECLPGQPQASRKRILFNG